MTAMWDWNGMTPGLAESAAQQFAAPNIAVCAFWCDDNETILLGLAERTPEPRQVAGYLTRKSTLGEVVSMLANLEGEMAASVAEQDEHGTWKTRRRSPARPHSAP